MPDPRVEIIAEPSAPSGERRLAWLVFAAATAAGSLGAWYYARLGLTLSHFDARSHLVVARRVFDSLTPGWRQIGALWLPLPHLLNLIPVQFDWNYRTGFSAVALSIASLAWGLAAVARLIRRRTGSAAAGLATALLILGNPNVLYLQSTPLTEPMLFGLSLAALEAADAWLDGRVHRTTAQAGAVLALAMLTRYEAWPLVGALVVLAGLAAGRGRLRDTMQLACWPLGAVLAFLVLSKTTTDSWLISSGFFVPVQSSVGDWPGALAKIVSGTRIVARWPTLVPAIGGTLWLVVQAMRERSWRPLMPLALAAMILLPFTAFSDGHPYRVRYMAPAAVAAAVAAGFAIGALRGRARVALALAVVVLAFAINPPLNAASAVPVEAQWEQSRSLGRQAVSAYLVAHRDGTPILLSMSSLGHYVQELAREGFSVRDFLHEGNGDLWTAAMSDPERHVRWILIEELGRGGDALYHRAQCNAQFLHGFARVAEGGGLALYERTADSVVVSENR